MGPSWGYVGPSWGLCCPILRLCWPILRPMLAHVDPSRTTIRKIGKNGNSQKHRKTREFLMVRGTTGWGGRSAAGAAARPSLVRRGEMPYGKDTANSGPGGPKRRPGAQLCWPILWLCWPMLAYLEGYVGS